MPNVSVLTGKNLPRTKLALSLAQSVATGDLYSIKTVPTNQPAKRKNIGKNRSHCFQLEHPETKTDELKAMTDPSQRQRRTWKLVSDDSKP